MLAPSIEEKKDDIAVFCREHKVRALWVFGSAVTDRFDPETSDVDILVDLGEYGEDVARRFFRLRRSLSRLLKHNVDLVTIGGLTRSPVRDEILRSKVRVYDARFDDLAA